MAFGMPPAPLTTPQHLDRRRAPCRESAEVPFDRHGNMWRLLQLGILQSSDIDAENRVRIPPAEADPVAGLDAPIRCASPELPRRLAPLRTRPHFASPMHHHDENADPNVQALQSEIRRLEAEALWLRKRARRADLLEHLVDGFCALKVADSKQKLVEEHRTIVGHP